MKACHDEPCRGIFDEKTTSYKILLLGYYWPYIFKDGKEYVKRCDRCQRMGNPIPLDEIPLQPHVLVEPLKKWTIDFVGPINPPSKKKRYILVCTYYVTKWEEPKPLLFANENVVVTFLFEDILTHFGVPREIVTDQGTQFTSKLVQKIMEKYKIKH